MNEDVPYGEDFHAPDVARQWADSAISKRPWRARFFDWFAAELNAQPHAELRILELGSGPGFLAEHILQHVAKATSLTLLDFSQAMLDLSRERLRGFGSRASFVQADFKSDAWPSQVSGSFHAVVSMQAIHELRHKRHAPELYARTRPLLAKSAVALICDHLPGVLPNSDRLYMTEAEQLEALASGGFREGRVIQTLNKMALYRAFA